MANPYPAEFLDDTGEVRLSGSVDFTDSGNQPGSGLTGDGSPSGVVAATAIGETYTDTTNGALYLAEAADNSHWVLIGGSGQDSTAGVTSNPTAAALQEPGGASVEVSAGLAFVGSGSTTGKTAILAGMHGAVVTVSDDGAGNGALGFFNTGWVGKQTVTGSLSTVVDASAKAVLTSVIAALAAYGLVTDGTT